MAMGYGGPAPFAFARPSPQPRHLRRRAGLVDEDQPFRSEPCLAFEPEPAPCEHVRALLLRCMASLFLCVSPRLAKKCQTVDGHTRTPCDAASFSPISASVISLVCATRSRIKASCASSFEPGGWPWRSDRRRWRDTKTRRGPPCRQTPSDRLDDPPAEDHSRNNAPCLTPKSPRDIESWSGTLGNPLRFTIQSNRSS